MPRLVAGEHYPGGQGGRSIPLAKGGVNAPPAELSIPCKLGLVWNANLLGEKTVTVLFGVAVFLSFVKTSFCL